MTVAAVVVAFVVVVAAVVAALAGAAVVVHRRRERANRTVASVPSRAPSAWAGSHSPEARLHRRLGDAVRAAEALAAGDPGFHDVQAAVAAEALALDDRLVVVAALPARQREAPLLELAAAVARLEARLGDLATSAHDVGRGIDEAVAEAKDRLRLLSEARAELDAVDPGERRAGT